jgi:GH35 family endo-1,4-beta-xylanase
MSHNPGLKGSEKMCGAGKPFYTENLGFGSHTLLWHSKSFDAFNGLDPTADHSSSVRSSNSTSNQRNQILNLVFSYKCDKLTKIY